MNARLAVFYRVTMVLLLLLTAGALLGIMWRPGDWWRLLVTAAVALAAAALAGAEADDREEKGV